MTERSLLFSPAPYHILSYGALFGTTFFHTFVGGILAFKALPRLQFSALMTKIFPYYFSIQTVLPVVMALTYPGSASSSLTAGGRIAASGVAAVLQRSNRWSVLVPIAGMFLTGLANLVVLLPATTACMAERRVQEKKDGKRSWDPPPHSQEMQALNQKFGMLHGISSLLNLGTFVFTVIYGATLASRIE